eukprot:881856-Prorocentrum_lima.AAC.1
MGYHLPNSCSSSCTCGVHLHHPLWVGHHLRNPIVATTNPPGKSHCGLQLCFQLIAKCHNLAQ